MASCSKPYLHKRRGPRPPVRQPVAAASRDRGCPDDRPRASLVLSDVARPLSQRSALQLTTLGPRPGCQSNVDDAWTMARFRNTSRSTCTGHIAQLKDAEYFLPRQGMGLDLESARLQDQDLRLRRGVKEEVLRRVHAPTEPVHGLSFQVLPARRNTQDLLHQPDTRNGAVGSSRAGGLDIGRFPDISPPLIQKTSVSAGRRTLPRRPIRLRLSWRLG